VSKIAQHLSKWRFLCHSVIQLKRGHTQWTEQRIEPQRDQRSGGYTASRRSVTVELSYNDELLAKYTGSRDRALTRPRVNQYSGDAGLAEAEWRLHSLQTALPTHSRIKSAILVLTASSDGPRDPEDYPLLSLMCSQNSCCNRTCIRWRHAVSSSEAVNHLQKTVSYWRRTGTFKRGHC